MNSTLTLHKAICACGLSVAAIFGIPAKALPLPGRDLPALLRVNSVRQIFFGPDISRIDHRQSLISRGGGLFELLATGSPGNPPFTVAFRGLGTTAELATLGQALVDSQVGQQRDCTLGSSGIGHMEITWYGRNGRQNTFVVTFQSAEPPPEEACSVAVDSLVSTIERFVGDAVSGFPQD